MDCLNFFAFNVKLPKLPAFWDIKDVKDVNMGYCKDVNMGY